MALNTYRNEPLQWIAVLLLFAAPMVWSGCDRDKGRQAGPPPVPQVGTITIEPQSVELTTELPGRTSAYQVADIRQRGRRVGVPDRCGDVREGAEGIRSAGV